MKRFLKILIVACALLLMFGLVSCTNQTEAPGQPNASEGNNASAPSVAPQQNNATKPSAASEKDNALTSPPLGNGVTSGQGVKVHFIDVGQADSILIQLTDGKTVLIDGGNRNDAAVIDNYLQAQKVKTIDYLIATHPHEDHIGALPYLIKNYAIGSIYMPKVTANTKIFEDLLTQIKTKGLKINTAKAGVNLIDSGDTKLSLLAPNGTNYDETNEYSAVAKLVYKDTSFLFTGDAEAVSEKEFEATTIYFILFFFAASTAKFTVSAVFSLPALSQYICIPPKFLLVYKNRSPKYFFIISLSLKASNIIVSLSESSK